MSMRDNKDENMMFVEACKKAGLKVHTKANSKVASGLVIVDARGRKYIVNSNAKIENAPRERIRVNNVESALARVVRETGVVANRNRVNKYNLVQHSKIFKKQED